MVPQTVLALRGSDGFSRDRGRVSGVCARSSSAISYCKYAVKVTLTFATLQRNRGSRVQIHKNSMDFVNFLVQSAWAAGHAQILADQSSGRGQKHKIWSDMGRESAVWLET